MKPRNIIVIGASAGGLEAIQKLVMQLPSEIPAAILVVWHMGVDNFGILPEVLDWSGSHRAANALHGEEILANRIYVAPPDHHMLIDNGHIMLTHGPKENRFRPAIDPLFRSASFAYGPRVIGIILSGALDDGVAGLWTIKKYGGLAIVQDPEEAVCSSMPLNALKHVRVDYKVTISEMAKIIPDLCVVTVEEDVSALVADDEQLDLDLRVAKEVPNLDTEILANHKLTPFTCPECAGVLSIFNEAERPRYRCHTGHAYSADTLLASLTEIIEAKLWSSVRALQESHLLLTNMGDHFASANDPKLAGLYFRKARDSRDKEALVQKAIHNHEVLDTDSMAHQAAKINTVH